MFGLEQGLTPAQAAESQANFRMGFQTGTEQTKQQVGAENAMAQVQATNQAELQRQAAITQQLNEGRANVAKIKADEMRDATAAKATELGVHYTIQGLERGAATASRKSQDVISHPEMYDDKSLTDAYQYSGQIDALTAQATSAIGQTPPGKMPDAQEYSSKMGDLVKTMPSFRMRDSWLKKINSQTDANNRKNNPNAVDDTATAVDTMSPWLSNALIYQHNKSDQDKALEDFKTQNKGNTFTWNGADPVKTERGASDRAYADASRSGMDALMYAQSKKAPEGLRALVGELQQKNLPIFSPDNDDITKVGSYLAKRMKNTPALNDDPEFSTYVQYLTAKPPSFWTNQNGTGVGDGADLDPAIQNARQNARMLQYGAQSNESGRGAALRSTMSGSVGTPTAPSGGQEQ